MDLQGALVNEADRGWSPSRQGVCRGLWVGALGFFLVPVTLEWQKRDTLLFY